MIPADVLRLERLFIGADWQPTLANAYESLYAYWQGGHRERDVGLHLLFLAWYLILEPPHITGLDIESPIQERLQPSFEEVHSHFSEILNEDVEFLYVVGLMAQLSPWLLGDEKKWSELSSAYQKQYRLLCPDGIKPSVFDETTAYGDYFAGQARVKGGY